MILFFHFLILLPSILLFGTPPIQANVSCLANTHVIDHEWERIQDYFLPNDHPLMIPLNHIFSQSRVLADQNALIAAGFDAALPQHHTQIIVTRHPQLRGYVIKAHLDDQPYRNGKCEMYYWIKRVKGSRLIQKYLKKYHYEHLFKVPKKWIYLLPADPSPQPEAVHRICILIEEDMNIFGNKKNEKLWRSTRVTKKLLKALYAITTDLGLFDCAKPGNCSFSRDGRLAFVDTQSFYCGYVKYEKLTPYLSHKMRNYWEKLQNKISNH